MQKTDEELLQEFLSPSFTKPGLVVTDFDSPIPDLTAPFPPQLSTNWRRNDEDALSDYSNLSQNPMDNFVQRNNSFSSTSFLSVPGLQRNRSASITSNNSFSSTGLDGLEIGSDWGEIQPFPDAHIVNVPPNWIGAINSPTNSILSDCPSPSSAYGRGQSLDSTFKPQAEQFLDFKDFYQKHQPVYNHSILESRGNSPNLEYVADTNIIRGMSHTPSSDSFNTLKNFQEISPVTPEREYIGEEDPYRPTTVPDGRFWNVVKDNGQTLYQCPFPSCGKSKFCN
jgi:hypothetical protein